MKKTIIIRDGDADAPTGVATPISRPGGPPARSHKARAVMTFACALLADGMQWLVPFLWPVWDGAMVVAILVLWGWRWEVLIAVVPELIPGLELAPTWTIFAAYIVMSRRKG